MNAWDAEMGGTATGWPSGLVEWLEALLHARISSLLRLQGEGSHIRIGVEGSPMGLRVRSTPETFAPGAPPPRMAWWEPEAGWESEPSRDRIPAPGLADGLRSLLDQGAPDTVVAHYDLFGLFFWALARVEEVGCPDVDEHGRFPSRCAHAVRHGYLDHPIVDEWMSVLCQWVARLWPGLAQVQPRAVLRLSHDVDWASRYAFRPLPGCLRAMGGDLVHSARTVGPITVAAIRASARRGAMHPADPYNTFGRLMEVSEQLGEPAVFYFMAGRSGTAHDGHYEIDHPAIRGLIRVIAHRGHRIGLHPSYHAYLDRSVIQAELARLRAVCAEEGVVQEAWGARMHYLRWKAPDTPRLLAEAGLAWDASLGYADRPGFRCGTCFDYPAFDPVRMEATGISIRPLIVMDVAALRQATHGTIDGVVADHWAAVHRWGGACEVLIHNSFDLNALDLGRLVRLGSTPVPGPEGRG